MPRKPRRPNFNYTPEIREQIWDSYQRGDTLRIIGDRINRKASDIHALLLPFGGIRPRLKKRSALALSFVEREEISRGLAEGLSLRHIASILGRSASTVSREINRNGGRKKYRAIRADQRAQQQALRPKSCKLSTYQDLRDMVISKLKERWSPQQIAGWLSRQFPDDRTKQVSHETIYRTLFIQSKGVLKKELQQYLRSKKAMRSSRYKPILHAPHGGMPGAISISERPASVEDRAIPGHWEGDLIVGLNQSYIITLVERTTRFVLLAKLDNKKADTMVKALVKQAKTLPQALYKSLTWDRGVEMKGHQKFTLATDIQVYFCDPKSPWQRGTNENTNRLLREYLPKQTDLSVHSQKELDKIAKQLNERPRKTLGFETPAECFNRCVALTT